MCQGLNSPPHKALPGGGQHRVCEGSLAVWGLLLLHITRVHLCFPLFPCLRHHSGDLPVTSPTTPVTSNDWRRHMEAEHRISSQTEAGEALVPILSRRQHHFTSALYKPHGFSRAQWPPHHRAGRRGQACFTQLYPLSVSSSLGCLSLEYDASSCL